MKRSSVQIIHDDNNKQFTHIDNSIHNIVSTKGRKIRRTIATELPPLLLPISRENKVSKAFASTLKELYLSTMDEDVKMTEIDFPRLMFLFFLGAQGKEYMEQIVEGSESQFPYIFITCNASGQYVSKNHQCNQLSTELKVLDPLGGGLYPLNYLFVIDPHGYIRSAVPLVLNRSYGNAFEKSRGGEMRHSPFGISLKETNSFINEYKQYFQGNH